MNLLLRANCLLLLLPLLSGCNFFDSKMVTACEEVLKGRLLAPSEYKRIEIKQFEEPIGRADFEHYFADNDLPPVIQKLRKDQFDRGELKPLLYLVLISYDAPNAYGTPVRSISRCEYPTMNGDDSGVYKTTVLVDGETSTDWLMKQIKLLPRR